MTSNNFEKQLAQQLTKADIETKALSFNIAAPVSEEEFSDSLQSLGAYLLFNTNWDYARTGKAFPKTLPVVGDVSLVCKAEQCIYHDQCPAMKGLSQAAKEKLVGTQCRVERHYGVTFFADIVKDLSISPDQSIDLLNAANLVRWMIYRRRLDWAMNIEGSSLDGIVAVNPISGVPFYETKGHPLLKEIERADKMIESAQKSLVASRKDRIQLASQLGRGQSVLKSLFSKADYIDVEETLPPEEEESEE